MNRFDKEEIAQLLNMLNPKRSDDYSSWIQILKILSNYGGSNSKDYIEMARTFSKKSSKFNELEFVAHWIMLDELTAHSTINSLYCWAREDNPILFNKWNRRRIMNEIFAKL
jgi:hypothetical protein